MQMKSNDQEKYIRSLRCNLCCSQHFTSFIFRVVRKQNQICPLLEVFSCARSHADSSASMRRSIVVYLQIQRKRIYSIFLIDRSLVVNIKSFDVEMILFLFSKFAENLISFRPSTNTRFKEISKCKMLNGKEVVARSNIEWP